jgi:hypothetical protein
LATASIPASWAERQAEQFGCEVLYEQPENKLLFSADSLDKEPALGNLVTYSQVAAAIARQPRISIATP